MDRGVMTVDPSAPVTTANPYVGPQSFRRGERLYGRDRAAAELLDLLVAERIVLLHSPSGAGKTSLIQARMLGQLEEERFDVLPVVRLSHELPPEVGALGSSANRYVVSTLLSLEERLPRDRQRSMGDLAGLSLAQYLADHRDADGQSGNTVLIFDQFEEVITADPVDQDVKTAFFQQLGVLLRDRTIWALLSMREDFLAELDPYARLVPTRFSTRYRLDLLTQDEALEAIVRPAVDAGIDFRADAADKLVNDLRRVRVQRGAAIVEELGPYVEPVQLQVACRGVWDRLDRDARTIGLSDVEAVGVVNEALAAYYADCISSVAAATGVSERALRTWVEEELITPQGFRGQAMHGPSVVADSDAGVLGRLTSAHLLRAESRRGAIWYELAHDRLIDPVKEDNENWRQQHLSDFERRAMLWEGQGHPDSMLLQPQEFDAAQAWASGRAEPLTDVENEFFDASRKARDQAEKDARANRRIRRWLVASVVGLVLALIASGLAVNSTIRADRATLRATEAAILGQSLAQLDKNTQLSLRLAARAAALQHPDGGGLTTETQNALQLGLSTTPVLSVVDSGEPSPTVDAAYSRDGTRIVSWHEDGTLKVRAALSGAMVWSHKFAQPEGFAVNADGSRVAVSNSGQVAVWPAQGSSKPVAVPSGGTCDSLAFSPDSTWLACTRETTLLVFEAATGKVRYRLGTEVFQAQWSGQGSWAAGRAALVAVTETGLTVWDSPSARPRTVKLEGPLALSPRGGLVAVGTEHGVDVFGDLGGRKLSTVELAGGAGEVSFSADGSVMAIVDLDGKLSTWESATGQALRAASEPGPPPMTVELAPSGDRALVVDEAGALTVWDVAAGHPDEQPLLAVDADGESMTMSPSGGIVRLWSADGRPRGQLDLAARLGLPTPPADPQEEGVVSSDYLAVDPDGRYIVIVGPEGQVRVVPVDPKRAPTRLRLAQKESVISLATSPTGRFVAAAFVELDEQAGVLTEPGVVGSDGGSIGPHEPDPGVGQVESPPSGVYVWDATTGARIARITSPQAVVSQVEFSPDDTALAGRLETEPSQIAVWDVASGRRRLVIRVGDQPGDVSTRTTPPRAVEGPPSGQDVEQSASIVDVAWAGQIIAAAYGDNGQRVGLWDAGTGAALGTSFRAHADQITDIAFSADGTKLVTAALDKSVAIWEVSDHHLVRRVNHPTPVYRVSFGAGDRRLIVVGDGGVPQVIWLDPTELLARARASTTRSLTTSECAQYLGDESLCASD